MGDKQLEALDGEEVRKGLLSVRTVHDGDACVVTPTGELDMDTGDLLDEELAKAEASGARRIVLDLSELTFMATSGMRLVLRADARSRADSNRLRLVRGSRRVQRVFQLAGMESQLFD